MENKEILAYLDHNVLDLMTKGDPYDVKDLLQKQKLTPIYSDESLKEIQRSKGYESKFLDLLEDVSAKYIVPLLDQNFKQTGQTKIHTVSPKICYENFLNNQKESPTGDFGLSEISMKLYGGQQNRSFKEIFAKGAVDLQKHMMETVDSLDELSIDHNIDIESLKKVIAELPEIMNCQSSTMAKDMDKLADSPISTFDKEIGLGPIVLKNVKPPNVVEKIWLMFSEKPNFPANDIEKFFGVKPNGFGNNFDSELTIQEKVNAIYHQLNFLGYYRDSKMKKERRFKASFSDMTHAGIASLCHVFLCGDEDLVMKAAAAFEYLGVQTKILHYKSNATIRPSVNE